jgi:hypothetical protein
VITHTQVTTSYQESLSISGDFSFVSGSYDPGSGGWSESSQTGSSLSQSSSFTLTDTVSCIASAQTNCYATNEIYNGTYSFPVTIQGVTTIQGAPQNVSLAGTFTGTGGAFTYASAGNFSLPNPAKDSFTCTPNNPAVAGTSLDPNVREPIYISHGVQEAADCYYWHPAAGMY